jgi:ATP-binding cassette subfamily B protein
MDVRDATLESLHATVGAVTQDAHMFHDTIRSNLKYAKPEATDEQIWKRVTTRISPSSGPSDGLDTVVGDGSPVVRGESRELLGYS